MGLALLACLRANGGTGAVTATAALTNLLPALVSGDVLTNNGTVASWGVAATGTVTSVTRTSPFSVGTGTTTPAITLGTVPVTNGRTGAITPAAALTNLLPIQTGNGGLFLETNGTTTSWAVAPPGTVTSVSGRTSSAGRPAPRLNFSPLEFPANRGLYREH